jgi:small subunit ribosomal protein S21
LPFEATWQTFIGHNKIKLFNILGGIRMTQVTVGENEGIESALRRFRREVSKAGIFADMKRLRHFETPQEKKKRKAIARRRKKRFS